MSDKNASNILSEETINWIKLLLSGEAKKADLTHEVAKAVRPVAYRKIVNIISDAGFKETEPVYVDGLNTLNSVPLKYTEYERVWERTMMTDVNTFMDSKSTSEEDKKPALCESDEASLTTAINEFLPVWTQHKKVVPYTIIIPTSEMTINGGLIDKKSCWEHFILEEKDATKFANNGESVLAFVKVLSALGVSSTDIENMLVQFGKTDTRYIKVDNPSYRFVESKKQSIMLLQGELKRLVTRSLSYGDKQQVNAGSEIIMRLDMEDDIKYSTLSAEKIANIKANSSATEKVVEDGFYYRIPCSTENDQVNIRAALVLLMGFSSGLIFTINIPIISEEMHMEKGSTPTLIIPHAWCETIKRNRTSNRKGKTPAIAEDWPDLEVHIEDPNIVVKELSAKERKELGLD